MDRKKIIILICLGLMISSINLFFFFTERGTSITGSSIKMIDSVEDINKTDMEVGDCWEVKDIGKIICYHGVRSIKAGKIEEIKDLE